MNKVFLLLVLIFMSCSKDGGGDSPKPNPPEEKPNYTLLITASEGGSVNTNGGTFPEGTSITITATPETEYLFNNWSGTKNSTNNPLRFILTSNENIIANFELKNSNNDQNPDNPIGPVINQD